MQRHAPPQRKKLFSLAPPTAAERDAPQHQVSSPPQPNTTRRVAPASPLRPRPIAPRALVAQMKRDFFNTIAVNVDALDLSLVERVPGITPYPNLVARLAGFGVDADEYSSLERTRITRALASVFADFPLMQRRDECTVVVVDREGEHDGDACKVARVLMREGVARRVVYLAGGMNRLRVDAPELFVAVGAVDALRKRQDALVEAVWGHGAAVAMVNATMASPSSPRRMDRPVEIVKGVYLGSHGAARRECLDRLQIRTVVRLGWGFLDAGGDDVAYHDFEIDDQPGENIKDLFSELIGVIRESVTRGDSVLVHCHAGVSRSATAVIAYLMCEHGMRLDDAFEHVYLRRPIIRPNDGFARSLVELEAELRDEDDWSSLPVFWMADSYYNYIEYLDFRHRQSESSSSSRSSDSDVESVKGEENPEEEE